MHVSLQAGVCTLNLIAPRVVIDVILTSPGERPVCTLGKDVGTGKRH